VATIVAITLFLGGAALALLSLALLNWPANAAVFLAIVTLGAFASAGTFEHLAQRAEAGRDGDAVSGVQAPLPAKDEIP